MFYLLEVKLLSKFGHLVMAVVTHILSNNRKKKFFISQDHQNLHISNQIWKMWQNTFKLNTHCLFDIDTDESDYFKCGCLRPFGPQAKFSHYHSNSNENDIL